MAEKQNLLEQLKQYGETDAYPFHMPGHKRREFAVTEDGGFPDPYAVDITEIDGFDNLHHAEGILREAMDEAAAIYGADRSYYMVNGSSGGILSAICALTKAGDQLLMARNSHISAYHAVILGRLSPVCLYPEPIPGFELNGGIRVQDVKEALKADCEHRIRAVYLVSPTYEGIVSDIRAIAETAHIYGIPLIVDEAHGAHFPFGDRADAREDALQSGETGGAFSGYFPQSALSLGADVVIQSLHKTLPAFTQTAILHVKGELVDWGRLERYLRMFQSSSPSYILMAGIERCIRYMDGAGRTEMRRYLERLEQFYAKLRSLRFLRVLGVRPDDFADCPSVYAWDPSKIVISTEGTARPGSARSFTGYQLGDLLRERFHLEPEMCAPNYVIAMTSLMDTEEGFARLAHALLTIDGELAGERRSGGGSASADGLSGFAVHAEGILTPAEALDERAESTPFEACTGRISAEFVFFYPPGIPLLVPGEQITEPIREFLLSCREQGFDLQGLQDPTLTRILTVAPDSKSVLQ